MRIRVGLTFLVVAGCSAAPRAPVPAAVREPATAIVAPPVVDAGAAEKVVEKPEEPLAWGQRSPANGPFYPVIEGDCTSASVWPLDDGNALFTYGSVAGSTIARFTEDGLVDVGQTKQTAFREGVFFNIHGSWPEPLLAMTSDRESNRARNYETLWAHRTDGWVSLMSHRDQGSPEMSTAGFFRGNAIVQRHPGGMWGSGSYMREGRVEAIPVVTGATKLTGFGDLRRDDMEDAQLGVASREIYLLGKFQLPFQPNQNIGAQYAQILHVWRDGKVREVKLPPGTADRLILAIEPSLVIVTRKREIRRLVEGDKWEPVPFDVGPNDEVYSMTTAPDGATWVALGPGFRYVRRDASGKQEEMKPPSDPEVTPARQGYSSRETRILGIPKGDPWALSPTGTLSHLVDGAWQVVPTARVRVESIAVVAKGDVYVVGSFDEKLPGWSRASRRMQVLRTKRPKEVLRCNESLAGTTTGHGFTSFPPRATAECKTPFAILMRTAYATSAAKPKVIFDAKAPFKDVREAVGEDATELLEIASGDQRYLGFVPASLDAGNRAIEALAKKVKASPDFRPEIVCGVPSNVVRTIKTKP